ncbi:MAG: type IV toxin-antitoxin system AbiEi family antitoxin domain-containing protein [Calditrichia bacterium]
MKSGFADRVLQMVKENGVLRPRDLEPEGIPRIYLKRLVEKGLLRKISRGLYVASDAAPTVNHSLAQIAKKIPNGVVCLLSALQFHGITTQQHFEIWLALDMKARKPKILDFPVRIVRFTGASLNEGIETHTIEGVPVKVYNIAKTVTDCFKYRNKVGLDVALEALRECRQERRCSMDELWDYAKICRVANVMRPYLEAIG